MEEVLTRSIKGGFVLPEEWTATSTQRARDSQGKLLPKRIDYFYHSRKAQQSDYFRFFLDPLFWQALSKTEDWGSDEKRLVAMCSNGKHKTSGIDSQTRDYNGHFCWECGGMWEIKEETYKNSIDWLNKSNDLWYHAMEGDDLNIFFKDLLK